jgi:hypothetical protein
MHRMEEKLWHWSLPLKLKNFIWLAANDKILTWDILLRRGGWDPICAFSVATILKLSPTSFWTVLSPNRFGTRSHSPKSPKDVDGHNLYMIAWKIGLDGLHLTSSTSYSLLVYLAYSQ